jgi:hypothetical protein
VFGAEEHLFVNKDLETRLPDTSCRPFPFADAIIERHRGT